MVNRSRFDGAALRNWIMSKSLFITGKHPCEFSAQRRHAHGMTTSAVVLGVPGVPEISRGRYLDLQRSVAGFVQGQTLRRCALRRALAAVTAFLLPGDRCCDRTSAHEGLMLDDRYACLLRLFCADVVLKCGMSSLIVTAVDGLPMNSGTQQDQQQSRHAFHYAIMQPPASCIGALACA